MVLPVKHVGPLGESLFSKRPVFSLCALGEPLNLPASRVWMTDHNQCHALSRREGQGCFRLEQTFFVASFDKSHGPNHTTEEKL